jgi:hypothetical protein
VFEAAFVRGFEVAGDGDEVPQLDTTVTETPNEALTVAASTDDETSMLSASTTTEYLMRPSAWVDVRGLAV